MYLFHETRMIWFCIIFISASTAVTECCTLGKLRARVKGGGWECGVSKGGGVKAAVSSGKAEGEFW